MDDALSKVVGIVMGCILLFIMPVIIEKSMQNRTIQTYVYSETVQFVDEIRNCGKISSERMQEYRDKLVLGEEILEMEIMIISAEPGKREDQYTAQIMSELEINRQLKVCIGDFVRVRIWKSRELFADYGGRVRDET